MKLTFSKQAIKDIKLSANEPVLKKNTGKLLEILKNNPFQNPPPYEKLSGDLNGFYSRRINIQHRLVYQVVNENEIKILRARTHYE